MQKKFLRTSLKLFGFAVMILILNTQTQGMAMAANQALDAANEWLAGFGGKIPLELQAEDLVRGDVVCASCKKFVI